MSDCQCDNEAEVLYKMYKFQNKLQDGEWDTPVCCKEGIARMTVSGKTLTLVYADGSTAQYTEQL